MKFVELAKNLHTLSPIYAIEGEEAYFRDHAVAAIREACALTQPVLNDVRLEGEALKGERLRDFAADLRTLPFFDGHRLVRVSEFHPTEREWEDVLRAYAESPCPTTVLVVVNAAKRANTVDWKKKKGVVYVDCARESEETLARWLYGVMRRRGLTLDGDAAVLMVRYCAQDAARMYGEAEKLSLLLGEGGRVTREVVEENVAKDVEYKVYELTQAASRGNRSAFSEILFDLMDKGFDENAALSALVSHWRTLYEVTAMTGSDEATGAALGVKAYAVKRSRETAARLGRDRVREMYERLYALSAGSRSGLYAKSGALAAAMAKIFFG